MISQFPTTLEVMHKVKCGQNIFRKTTIQSMLDEFFNLAEQAGVDVVTAEMDRPRMEYHAPVLSIEEKEKAQQYAINAINKGGTYRNIIVALCAENMRLVKEIQEHRAARGIEPLPVFEV
jgi:hypothetical protein